MDIGIWWIKRDMRLHDNQALCQAIAQHQAVLPVFFIEPALLQAEDSSRFHWHNQLSALLALKTALQDLGADLLILHQAADVGLAWLHRHLKFSALYSHQETGNNLTFQRDIRVAAWCKKYNIRWQQYEQFGVLRGLKSREQRQKRLQAILFQYPPLPPPTAIQFTELLARLCQHYPFPTLNALPIQDVIQQFSPASLQVINEQRALATLDDFLYQRGLAYRGGISSPNTAFVAGSRLSAHLAWGTISLRHVFFTTLRRMQALKGIDSAQAIRWRKSLAAFQSRLHWHCHFIQRLESAAYMEFKALNPAYNAVKYEQNSPHLQKWVKGETGFPLVDACMRCLHANGFLNFRMRAMVVNFACYALHLDWRDIHAPLAQLFADYEPGIHIAQLQMQAGIVGINTMRVYNVSKQLLEQDPNGVFCRQYISELRDVPMANWLNPLHNITDYPRPIVIDSHNINVMKQRIMQIRKSAAANAPTQQVLLQHGSRKGRNDRHVKAPRAKSTQQEGASKQLSFDL